MSVDTTLQVERLLDVRRYRAALQLLRPAFADSPNDPELHCCAARAALGLAQLDDAELHLRQVLSAQPKHLSARLLWFVLKRAQKRPGEAEEAILDVLREHPDNGSFLALYAELMLTNLQLEKARALASEALRREPEDVRAQVVNVLVRVIDGDDRGASELLADLVHDAPDELETVRTLYTVLVARRRYREALEVGRQLLHLAPDSDELVEALIALRAATHWTTLPLYPLTRYGWAASGALWFGGIVAVAQVGRHFGEQAGGLTGIAIIVYAVYSWVYPPLLRRWLRWRGLS